MGTSRPDAQVPTDGQTDTCSRYRDTLHLHACVHACVHSSRVMNANPSILITCFRVIILLPNPGEHHNGREREHERYWGEGVIGMLRGSGYDIFHIDNDAVQG